MVNINKLYIIIRLIKFFMDIILLDINVQIVIILYIHFKHNFLYYSI